jgi:hypothetical protein
MAYRDQENAASQFWNWYVNPVDWSVKKEQEEGEKIKIQTR